MPRPEHVDVAAATAWRRVPMPGANLPLDVVPLASDAPTFAIVARFPAGFVRDAPGGYVAAEEFLVLDGSLELEGVRRVPGDIVHVPAGYLRTDMRTEVGCTAIAWFGGPADFVGADELPACADAITATTTTALPELPAQDTDQPGWVTSRSTWHVVETVPGNGAGLRPGDELIDRVGMRWWRSTPVDPGVSGPLVLRRSR